MKIGELAKALLGGIDRRGAFETEIGFREASPVIERLNEQGLVVANVFHEKDPPSMRWASPSRWVDEKKDARVDRVIARLAPPGGAGSLCRERPSGQGGCEPHACAEGNLSEAPRR